MPWAAKSAVFQRLEQIADVASLTRQERMKYDEGLRKYRDTLSVLEGAREDGWAEGRAAGHAEGRAEGIKEEKLETAKRLLSAGVDVSTIVLATGLTVDEVKRLSPGE